jgi:hypothetical protein
VSGTLHHTLFSAGFIAIIFGFRFFGTHRSEQLCASAIRLSRE